MTNPYLEPKWTAGMALGRAISILRDDGPRSLFFKVAGELAYRRLRFDELRFEDVRPADGSGGHELLKLDHSNFDGYLEFRTDLNQSMIDERLRRGHECHAILADGSVAQSCWAAPGDSAWAGYLGCEIELGKLDVYVYEFVVHPAHRGRKLFPAALSGLVAEYRGRGYERIIWAWLPENRRAVSVARHWPFRPLGVVGYWQIAGWRKYFTSIPEGARPPRLSSDRLMRWSRTEPVWSS
jgi:GNAT superfamily N-acetyltransferase